MTRLKIGESFYLVPNQGERFSGGEVFHEATNAFGGSASTPVARVFLTAPDVGAAEGVEQHMRLDCFVRDHVLAPDPAWLARVVCHQLLRQGWVQEPLWLEWCQTTSPHGGEAIGAVFSPE